eukprot:scaffold368_cov258-Pinguiococcus_pyrenoidosus.AAC.9
MAHASGQLKNDSAFRDRRAVVGKNCAGIHRLVILGMGLALLWNPPRCNRELFVPFTNVLDAQGRCAANEGNLPAM